MCRDVSKENIVTNASYSLHPVRTHMLCLHWIRPHFFLNSLLQVYPVRSLFRHRHVNHGLSYPLADSSFNLTMPNRDLSLDLLWVSAYTISAITRWNCLATTDVSKSRSTPIVTVRWSFQRVFCLGSVRCGWTDPLYDYKAVTTTTGPNPFKTPTDVGRCTSEPRPCYKVSLSSMYSQRFKSRS